MKQAGDETATAATEVTGGLLRDPAGRADELRNLFHSARYNYVDGLDDYCLMEPVRDGGERG